MEKSGSRLPFLRWLIHHTLESICHFNSFHLLVVITLPRKQHCSAVWNLSMYSHRNRILSCSYHNQTPAWGGISCKLASDFLVRKFCSVLSKDFLGKSLSSHWVLWNVAVTVLLNIFFLLFLVYLLSAQLQFEIIPRWLEKALWNDSFVWMNEKKKEWRQTNGFCSFIVITSPVSCSG